MNAQQVSAILKNAVLADPGEVEKQLREVYGRLQRKFWSIRAPYIRMSDQTFNDLKQRIVKRWEDILALANMLPASTQWSEC